MRRSLRVGSCSSSERSRYALHPRLEREHARDERLPHLEDPLLPHGLLALVPRRQREPLAAAEVAEQMPQVQDSRLDVAVEALRQRVPDEHLLDVVARDWQRLQDATRTGLR